MLPKRVLIASSLLMGTVLGAGEIGDYLWVEFPWVEFRETQFVLDKVTSTYMKFESRQTTGDYEDDTFGRSHKMYVQATRNPVGITLGKDGSPEYENSWAFTLHHKNADWVERLNVTGTADTIKNPYLPGGQTHLTFQHDGEHAVNHFKHFKPQVTVEQDLKTSSLDAGIYLAKTDFGILGGRHHIARKGPASPGHKGSGTDKAPPTHLKSPKVGRRRLIDRLAEGMGITDPKQNTVLTYKNNNMPTPTYGHHGRRLPTVWSSEGRRQRQNEPRRRPSHRKQPQQRSSSASKRWRGRGTPKPPKGGRDQWNKYAEVLVTRTGDRPDRELRFGSFGRRPPGWTEDALKRASLKLSDDVDVLDHDATRWGPMPLR